MKIHESEWRWNNLSNENKQALRDFYTQSNYDEILEILIDYNALPQRLCNTCINPKVIMNWIEYAIDENLI